VFLMKDGQQTFVTNQDRMEEEERIEEIRFFCSLCNSLSERFYGNVRIEK